MGFTAVLTAFLLVGIYNCLKINCFGANCTYKLTKIVKQWCNKLPFYIITFFLRFWEKRGAELAETLTLPLLYLAYDEQNNFRCKKNLGY
jgi:hypothetical protein